MAAAIASSSYRRLVTDIASLYEGARKALVEAYWKIGQRIVEVEQQGAIKAAYGTGLLAKLSEDLTRQCGPGFSPDNLQRMRRFYLTYPKNAASRKLTWSQYVELLPLGNASKRAQLEKRVTEEGLTHKDIRKLVHAELVREQVAEHLSEEGKKDPEPVELLTPVRGTLYAYRIIQPKLVGENDSERLIDLGFSSYHDLDNITGKNYAPGTLVASVKDPEGNYKLSAISSGLESLYTYNAEVEKVVDGDTLRVVVDLGFGFKTRQYLRLRGLDCPEKETPEGQQAADFVRSRIRVATEIVLTSSKSDKYDRYLADVFLPARSLKASAGGTWPTGGQVLSDKDGKDIYLNNAILENGLAVRMNE